MDTRMEETHNFIELTPEPEQEGMRLDKYLAESLPEYSRSYLQQLIKSSAVSVNEKAVKASYQAKCGDFIHIVIPETEKLEIQPEDLPLEILYEDPHLLVVNKPQGMVVHPAAGHDSGTLVNALMYHCGDSLSSINGVQRPGIVHRIDKDTSGLLVVCKSDQAHRGLALQDASWKPDGHTRSGFIWHLCIIPSWEIRSMVPGNVPSTWKDSFCMQGPSGLYIR